MENTTYYYLENPDGGLVVDQYYMDNHFDPELQRIIIQGTKQQIEDFIYWLYVYNADIM